MFSWKIGLPSFVIKIVSRVEQSLSRVVVSRLRGKQGSTVTLNFFFFNVSE